jgi:hypothetical protein
MRRPVLGSAGVPPVPGAAPTHTGSRKMRTLPGTTPVHKPGYR